jgi:hypothetical protein
VNYLHRIVAGDSGYAKDEEGRGGVETMESRQPVVACCFGSRPYPCAADRRATPRQLLIVKVT